MKLLRLYGLLSIAMAVLFVVDGALSLKLGRYTGISYFALLVDMHLGFSIAAVWVSWKKGWQLWLPVSFTLLAIYTRLCFFLFCLPETGAPQGYLAPPGWQMSAQIILAAGFIGGSAWWTFKLRSLPAEGELAAAPDSGTKKHCGLGIASFILALGAPVVTMFLMLILITTIFIKNDFPVEKPEPFSPVMIIYMIPGIAEGVALSMGLSCFLIAKRKRGLAIAGVCISGGFLLLALTA